MKKLIIIKRQNKQTHLIDEKNNLLKAKQIYCQSEFHLGSFSHMKQKRNLVEKITIKQSTPAQSRKNYEVKSSLSKNQSAFQVEQRYYDDNNSQANSMQQFVDAHVPLQGQQQINNDESKQKTQNLEESKMYELKNNLSSLSASVSDINHQYNDLNESITKILATPKIKPNKRKISKLDHPQIAQFLFKKQQEQQQRQKRRLDEIARIQKLKAEKQQAQQKSKQQQKQEKINELKKQWFVKQKNQITKQQYSQKQKQAQEIFKKYRNSIPLFQIKEKLSKQQQSKKIQLMKQYLQKQKQNYMAINQGIHQKQLQDHNKKHQDKVLQLDKQKNQARLSIFEKIQKDNESMKNLYRGKVTQKIVQDLKIQQEKRQIPYRIRERTKGYESHVRENYKPKLRQSKLRNARSNSSSLELKPKRYNDSHLSVRQIKRYKYIQGISYGQIIQQRHLAKSYEDQRRTGKGYLEYMKSLPKKRVQNVESSILYIPKTSRPNPLLHNRKRTALVNITDEPTRDEINMILNQLRQNDKKIKEKQKIAYIKGHKHELMDSDRREINDDLLLNVEKKIDLLHKLENNKVKMGNQKNDEDYDD